MQEFITSLEIPVENLDIKTSIWLQRKSKPIHTHIVDLLRLQRFVQGFIMAVSGSSLGGWGDTFHMRNKCF